MQIDETVHGCPVAVVHLIVRLEIPKSNPDQIGATAFGCGHRSRYAEALRGIPLGISVTDLEIEEAIREAWAALSAASPLNRTGFTGGPIS
jgi:hypothetical protein